MQLTTSRSTRRAKLLTLCVLAASLSSAGCVFSIGSRRHHEIRQCRSYVEPSASAEILEIRAVSELSFDSSRRGGFVSIAQREGLSAEAQVYLVDTAMDTLSFDNSREKVLMALIHSPGFCEAGREAILRRLNSLSFDNHRRRVLAALSTSATHVEGGHGEPVEHAVDDHDG